MPLDATAATRAAWRRAILEYTAAHLDRPLKPKGLARELHISNSDYTQFRALVREMLREDTLVLGPKRTVVPPEHTATLVGTFHQDRHGYGRLECAGLPPALVRRGCAGGALDGDRVAARLLKRRGPRGRRVVEVTRIIERAQTCWVGVLEQRGDRWVVQPQAGRSPPLVQIDDPAAKAARRGDMVVVEPVEATLGTRDVHGLIIEKLGDPDQTRTKILSVVRRYGIPDEFSPQVRRAARRVASGFDPAATTGREDLRKLLTVTIDPLDARDFDDAITLRTLPHGRVELGVHIADVAHFVRADGVLDREARRRGNSLYFPGYVVPMLPEALSNGVCSLQPGQPRFAKSVFITYGPSADVCDTRFAESLIRSDRRLTYQQVTRILSGRPSDAEPAVVQLLRDAEKLARRILARRVREGMIVLTLPEVEIQLDERGTVVDAGPADTSFSHTIIEMFMVEANEAVSRLLQRHGVTHLRRIHPAPQPEPNGPLRQLTSVLGQLLPAHLDRQHIQQLLLAVRGKPAEPAVNLVLLQSMAPASYSPSAEGHFALASQNYCHFTSPIRRYPDLVNHRLLAACLRGRQTRPSRRTAAKLLSDSDLTELGSHTSATERRAQLAEREARTLLLLTLMKSKLGATLDGLVVGVAPFGVFVQVQPYLAEGLVHVADLGPEDWHYDHRAGALVARPTARLLTIGQTIRVRVAGVDQSRQELTLVPEDTRGLGAPSNRRLPRRRPPRRRSRRG